MSIVVLAIEARKKEDVKIKKELRRKAFGFERCVLCAVKCYYE